MMWYLLNKYLINYIAMKWVTVISKHFYNYKYFFDNHIKQFYNYKTLFTIDTVIFFIYRYYNRSYKKRIVIIRKTFSMITENEFYDYRKYFCNYHKVSIITIFFIYKIAEITT